MNKYLRAITDLPTAMIKTFLLKVRHGKNVTISSSVFMSPFSEVTVDKGAVFKLGKKFRQRSQAKIRVRKGAELTIGKDISLNHGCMIVAREKITIDDGVQFGPNVLLYDHDHDYKIKGGINAGAFKTSPIIIGKNVWIGAGSIILRGTTIGDNSVVAAGSVVKGEFKTNSLIYQVKETKVKRINF
ncbi:acyltransferase [Streptococcus jiangjianxini]|uniref:acyltransferase n=1 Tax=Streptococcus jiangjianxini TaxID=3161189 RepID=UPI0032EB2996